MLNVFSQNIQVDSQLYTPQQLIEDVLIDSNCITNVVVTNVVGGDFNNTDESYGYFDSAGTSFPFESGIVMSTGRLANVEGPNDSLSDDDAPNWAGDNDLENILNENNTINATIIEFEFISIADEVSFRYLFASEEYQENNPNTCRFSDLFGFLIRNVNDTQYNNIALVPDTQIPVKVTTVHPDIPNGCPAENEAYFGSWNGVNTPINFNGQTKVLTATASVIPGETYHVKLVIADEQNYRYDSAVFLEAGSFQLRTNLGSDRLLATNSPLCENETLELFATQMGNKSYTWYKDGVELLGETNDSYIVTDTGIYNVEIELENNCFSYGEITIEYTTNPIISNTTLVACDEDQDGFTTYNLFDAEQDVTNGDQSLSISNFYNTQLDALQETSAILSPTSFQNTSLLQMIYARVENQYRCSSIAEITLDFSNNILTIPPFEVCDDDIIDGITSFNLNDLESLIQPNVPVGASIQFYTSIDDAFSSNNEVNTTFLNTVPYSQTIFVKVLNNSACYAITTVDLNVLFTPLLLQDENTFYCLNTFPQSIMLEAGILNDSLNNYTYAWFLNNTLIANTETISINETGTYTVITMYSNGCASSRDIIVSPSNTATISSISIQEVSDNNSITISVSGEGNYEYALDNNIFQDSNTFTNVSAGFHTVFVNDINGCGVVEELISVLGFPKFFTPNGDSYNNTWKPFGVNAQFNANIDIKIYDRYGKLLKVVSPLGNGWNGTFNGNNLATDDYWYVVSMPDGKEYRGHFALVR
jgi:gliding motility-associated-like protein